MEMRVLRFIARDKKSIISFSLVHIAIVVFVCSIFSKIYIENIPFGVVDMDNSSLSRTIIQQFKNSPGLNVSYYADSQSELEQAIKEKKVSGGIVIPKDFNKDAVKMKSPTIALIIDETNMVVGSNIYAYGNSILGTVNANFQLSIFQGKNMLPDIAKKAVTSFSYGERILYETQLCYMRYLMYTLVPYLIQGTFLMTFLIPTLINNRKQLNITNIKSRDGLKNLLVLLARILMIIMVIIISSFIGLCILDKYYGLPLRGNVLEYFSLMFIFLLDITAIGFFFAAIIDNMIYFVQFFSMINIVIFLTSGVPFPEYMMPDGLSKIIKSLWPFMNVALQFKCLNLKGIGWDVIFPSIRNGILYALVWFPIGIGLYFARIALYKYKNKSLISSEEGEINLVS
jgi:ABC-2 type transport system permease protein